MSNHYFPSFNFPYTSSVDLHQTFSDYGRTGPVLIFKDEDKVKCISQEKGMTENRNVRLLAKKPTLPLQLPNKVVWKYNIDKTDKEQHFWNHERNILNFSSDKRETMYGHLAEICTRGYTNAIWKLNERHPKKFLSVVERFDDGFCEIPAEILDEFFLESCLQEKEEVQTGVYYGNCLAHWMDASDSRIVLAYPGGDIMDKLHLSCVEVHSENEGELSAKLVSRNECFDLPGRISQVSAVDSSSVLAVRTDYTCSFFKKEYVQDGCEGPAMTVLGNLACKTKPCSVAVNPFTPSEVIIAMETGSLWLWCGIDNSVQVVKKCSSCVQEDFDWYFCEFGPHPRQVLRANPKNMELLDLRDSSSGGKELMTLPSPHFFEPETFSAVQRHPENPYHYFLATSQSLVIMDERFQQNPVLKWCHSLESPIKYINVVPNAITDCQDVLLVVGGYNNHEVHCHQYCYGENTPHALGMVSNMGGLPPRSSCSPWKISSYSEWPEMLNSQDIPVEIFPAVTKRLNQPLIGLTCISNSSHANKTLTVFQLSRAGDLFYQCLSSCESTLTEERDGGQVFYYEDCNIDISSSGGCGSSKAVLTKNDENLIENWLKYVKQEAHEQNASSLKENSHLFEFTDAGLVHEMTLSELEFPSQCKLCGVGTSDMKNGTGIDDMENGPDRENGTGSDMKNGAGNNLGNGAGGNDLGNGAGSNLGNGACSDKGPSVGDCVYCGLDKDVAEKLKLTTPETVLTNSYLGITYTPTELEFFDKDEGYTDPLAVALLNNWISNVQTPINLEGGSEDPSHESQDLINENQTEIARNRNKSNTSSKDILSVNNLHAKSSQVSQNSSLVTIPKGENHTRTNQGCMGERLMNSPRTPTRAQLSQSSVKKKKLPRVLGF